VIFVTAHDAYAVRAFEVSAVDYLLKPFSEERLAAALERVQHGRKPSAAKNSGSTSPLTLDGAVVLRDASRIRRVEVRDIAAVVAEGSYTQVHFATDRAMLVLRTMADWEALLPAPPFLRLDRSLVVNLERITGIDIHSRDKGELTLQANGSPRLHLGRLALNRVRESLAS
jgi:two-component system LytT family response regulator